MHLLARRVTLSLNVMLNLEVPRLSLSRGLPVESMAESMACLFSLWQAGQLLFLEANHPCCPRGLPEAESGPMIQSRSLSQSYRPTLFKAYSNSSAHWIAFNAAPFLIWSPQTNRSSPRLSDLEISRRTRPTYTSSCIVASSGVGNLRRRRYSAVTIIHFDVDAAVAGRSDPQAQTCRQRLPAPACSRRARPQPAAVAHLLADRSLMMDTPAASPSTCKEVRDECDGTQRQRSGTRT